MRWVGLVNEIFAVKEFFDHVRRALLCDLSALHLKSSVSHLFRHRFSCPQCCDIEGTDPGHLAVPSRIKCVVLGTLQQPVLILILSNQELQSRFDFPISTLEEFVIRRHLMFPVEAQDTRCLPVVCDRSCILAPIINRTIRAHETTKIDLRSKEALNLREDVCDRLRIPPNVRTCPCATANALAEIEPTFFVESVACGRCQRGQIYECPIKEPMRQR